MIDATIDGRYRILRRLGQGGMGTVFEAEHVGTGRRVAVKVVNPVFATNDAMVVRFQREARAAGSIETSHIVQVLDTGTDASIGIIYMVMELLRGEDLQVVMRRIGALAPDLALRLVGQACVGLGKAHDADVIHRDIKPANLFLTTNDGGEVTVKLVDFGIAKIKGDVIGIDATGLTRTDGMLGTPRYMSPEQMSSSKRVDRRTDIWSLGVVLYQAMTGEWPHNGDNLGALVLAICSEPARPIQDLAPWVRPEIARLVHRALAPRPEDRFQSAREMLDAIGTLLPGGLSVRSAELVPFTDEQRCFVAPRAVFDGAIVQATRGATNSSGDSVLPRGVAGVSVSQEAPSPRPTSIAAVRWGVAVLALLGGGLVSHRLVGPAASNAIAEVAPPRAALAPSDVKPESMLGPSTVLTDERTERLAIEPDDCRVAVDDRDVPVRQGSVEIRGPVGSVHRVRLRKGGQERLVEVVIATSGVVPPKIGLERDSSVRITKALASVGARRPGEVQAPKSPSRAPATQGRNEKPSDDPAPARSFE